MRRGRCLCGDIQFEIGGDPVIVAHCHCRDCQRLSGAGHTTGAMFAAANVAVTGTPLEFQLLADSGNTVTRSFCGRCGSPLWGRNSGMPGVMTIGAGLFDEPDSLTPQVAVFTRTRRVWDAMDGSVAAFETQPQWKPEDGA